MIDWFRLLDDHHIHYVTAGPNTGRGEISIRCPLCMEADTSQHMGINLSTGKWNCWRDNTHRGISPARLICILLGVSRAEGEQLVKAYSNAAHDEFDILGGAVTAPTARPQKVVLPAEFDPIKPNNLTRKFWVHLVNRGFDNVERVIDEYNLKCCLMGRWKGRLIIPIYGTLSSGVEQRSFKAKVMGSIPIASPLLGWQGRSLRTVEGIPRYLTSSPDVKRIIYNMQNISNGGDTLYICEGPFDAIKIDYYGKPRIRATCVFGATLSNEQLGTLYNIASKFSRVVLLLDNDPTGITASFQLSDWLPNIEFGSLPEGHKDTDKISPDEMRRLKW